jgi:hypothetical protein
VRVGTLGVGVAVAVARALGVGVAVAVARALAVAGLVAGVPPLTAPQAAIEPSSKRTEAPVAHLINDRTVILIPA